MPEVLHEPIADVHAASNARLDRSAAGINARERAHVTPYHRRCDGALGAAVAQGAKATARAAERARDGHDVTRAGGGAS
jgi:hypothetical protein